MSSPPPKAIHGLIADYNEQGMESDYWLVFQDDAFISPDGRTWDREGMVRLGAGDHLTIYQPDGGVCWDGVIGERWGIWGILDALRLWRTYPWHPKGVSYETWVGWFRTRPYLRATLVRPASAGSC